MKFQIKHRGNDNILFSAEVGSQKLCFEAAVQAGADLADANLADANLAHANLADANLADANLAGANLAGADLAGANLAGADLAGADLAHANLAHANLAHANLAHANLADANLADANLADADLAGADLAGADLAHANLADAAGINPYRVTDLRMLLDQPGPIRAYKLVNSSNEGPFNGGIIYELGTTAEVDFVNTDETVQCGAGINLATLPWCMREWREGYKILVAEFVAADIVVIPHYTDGKFRVRRCTIVGEKDLVEIGLVGASERS